MNPTLVRLLPPGLVLTVAVWSGWPANTAWFEDQPASIARAARWQDRDLDVAQVARPTLDPFAAVLQPATQALPTVAVAEPPKAGPSPPTSDELLAYIQLEGFGSAGGRQWAVINGRPRNVGDVVLQRGHFPWACQVAQIADPHVIIRCGPAQLEVRLPQRGRRAAAPSEATSPEAIVPSLGPLTTGGDAPPVMIPHPPQHDLATGATL